MNLVSPSLVFKGYQRPLEAEDLWSLRDQDSSMRIMMDLEKLWSQKCEQLQ